MNAMMEACRTGEGDGIITFTSDQRSEERRGSSFWLM